jgi:hypothetical protein
MPINVLEIPFNSFIGIRKSSEPSEIFQLPAGNQYLNHLQTVHASAQIALAEASSGEFLLRAMGSSAGYVPVVRRIESKFRKPAKGAIRAKSLTPPEALDQLRRDLAAKGRATIRVEIELYDESDNHTLSAGIEWFITRVPDGTYQGNRKAAQLGCDRYAADKFALR